MIMDDWKKLVGCSVILAGNHKEQLRLGKLYGCGGAGAVFELPKWGNQTWALKILDPDSPIAKQEKENLKIFRGLSRHMIGLMKFNTWNFKVTFLDAPDCFRGEFDCYAMRIGKTLKDAIENNDSWLSTPKETMRLIAYLVSGLHALKNMGISHGDIKEDNILLLEHHDTFFPILADYGTVAPQKLPIKTRNYTCEQKEFSSPLEERIAYDLQCLYMAILKIYDISNDILLPKIPNHQIRRILRIMRDSSKKAFVRVDELTRELEADVHVPVSFYLDVVPTFDKKTNFNFERIIQERDYCVLKNTNIAEGEIFDPLALIQIPKGKYERIYDILTKVNDVDSFILPICRYYDDKYEYVVIHAPDDKNKCDKKSYVPPHKLRLQDSLGIPFTLEMADASCQEENILRFVEKLKNQNFDISLTPKDIWHVDGRFKLNLFLVDKL